MNKIIAGIVAIPLLVASMPKQASALSVVNPDVQKPQDRIDIKYGINKYI
ncbi:hypothetical protein [Nostoc sp.]